VSVPRGFSTLLNTILIIPSTKSTNELEFRTPVLQKQVQRVVKGGKPNAVAFQIKAAAPPVRIKTNDHIDFSTCRGRR
jgi:hypothetical protein